MAKEKFDRSLPPSHYTVVPKSIQEKIMDTRTKNDN